MVWGIMTVMAMTLQQLRDASDEDLIKAHDDIAHALNPSVSYYLDELGRRANWVLDTSSYINDCWPAIRFRARLRRSVAARLHRAGR